MKILLIAMAALGISTATEASAQVANLSGSYQCVQNCIGSNPASVAQFGWNLNLVNENGEPSRAWVDWPGHIWVDTWNEGAVYTPDGMTIQFDRGSVWQRIVAQVEPPADMIAYCARRFKSYDPQARTYLGYDGARHPCP